MSVRRLADQQPESFAFSPENQDWAKKEIGKYPPGRQASAILALLWRAQKQNNYWLPRPAIELVARMLIAATEGLAAGDPPGPGAPPEPA